LRRRTDRWYRAAATDGAGDTVPESRASSTYLGESPACGDSPSRTLAAYRDRHPVGLD